MDYVDIGLYVVLLIMICFIVREFKEVMSKKERIVAGSILSVVMIGSYVIEALSKKGVF